MTMTYTNGNPDFGSGQTYKCVCGGGGASSCDPHILLCKYCRYNIVNPNNLEQSAL